MRILFTLLILTFVHIPNTHGQTKPAATKVTVTMTDNGAQSELPFIQVARSPNLNDAHISCMYFGTKSESDVSVILRMRGSKKRYQGAQSFGVKIIIDEIPLKSESVRLVRKVQDSPLGEMLHLYVTVDEVAWMAIGNNLTFEVHDAENGTRYDVLTTTVSAMNEFKKFAQSILLIKSYDQ